VVLLISRINCSEEDLKLTENKPKIIGLPSIPENIAKKLIELGYFDIKSLAFSNAEQLSKETAIGLPKIQEIIRKARKKIGSPFEAADKIYEKRTKICRITTGSYNFDSLLGGGLETQSITEVYGAFRSGKTQLAFQLATNVQLPEDEGGLDAGAIFIDCEGSFRPERIVEMASARGLHPMEVLKNIIVARAYNSEHLLFITKQIPKMLKEKNIRLLIIDSVISHFRAEFIGQEALIKRQGKLNTYLHFLQNLASNYDIAVFITNQISTDPSIPYGDATQPTGGNILAHAPQTRIYLRRTRRNERIARLIDSPYLPEGEIIFEITSDGIRDQS